jgi:pilus assembly protein CpaC
MKPSRLSTRVMPGTTASAFGRTSASALAWILVIAILHTTTIDAQVRTVAAASVAAAAAGEAESTPVALVVGRSTVLNTATPIARVSLTSADIADALVTSSTQLLVHGKAPGTISMFVWSREGAVHRYEVVVGRDVERLSTQMQQLFPNEKIEIRSSGRDVVLAGTVSSKEIAEKAVSLSAGFVEKREDVVNLLQVAAPRTNQVLLRVRFAEVSRSALTELGLSLFTGPTGINNTLGRVTTQQFPGNSYEDLSWSKNSTSWGSPVQESSGKVTFSDFLNLFVLSEKYDLGMLIRALQTRGLFQSLAEPNLVAESGKEATFLAGGEFPIPVAQGSGANMSVSVQFKEFGIRLGFTPQVDGDRIHLKVAPEVSTLDFGNAVVMSGFRIPALSTRRTATELELRDGQTFAIAGLMNNTLSSTMQKIPGIGDIPVLGYLFRSKAAQKNRTELVVMITPQILREGSPGVTNALPRMAEPYLSPIEEKKAIAPPPAAFVPSAGAAAAAAPAAAPAAIAPVAPVPAAPVMTAVAPAPAAPAALAVTPAPVTADIASPSSAAPVVVVPEPVQAAPAPAIVPPPSVDVPDATPAAGPGVEPAAVPAPAADAPAADAPAADAPAAEPLSSESDPSPQHTGQSEAKLREEARLREVRQLAAQARQQALADSKQKTETRKDAK